MAGVLDQFDEATPLRRTYCSRVSAEEFETQAYNYTESALADLIDHLNENPDEYGKILRKKKLQEEEEGGIFSFFKVRLLSMWQGEDEVCHVSQQECEEQLEKLKQDMMKALDYAQECKGLRYSKRLADKRVKSYLQSQERVAMATPVPAPGAADRENVPPQPPPPPCPPTPLPPVPVRATTPKTRKLNKTLRSEQLLRCPLSERRPVYRQRAKALEPISEARAVRKKMFGQLQGSGGRRQLRATLEKSPGGTPVGGWRKQQVEPDMLPFFNAKLVEKFKNAKSPMASPTLASPGAFESPS